MYTGYLVIYYTPYRPTLPLRTKGFGVLLIRKVDVSVNNFTMSKNIYHEVYCAPYGAKKERLICRL